MIYILDKINGQLVKSEIVPMDKSSIPLKKDGWSFNWRSLSADNKGQAFILRTLSSPNAIEGALYLRYESNMLFMDVLELAPYNIGEKDKRYDYVAGCLIAFSCRESFKLEGEYKGFLAFVSKTDLIELYIEKYGAQLALGQRMFFDYESGEKLIDEYINRTKFD